MTDQERIKRLEWALRAIDVRLHAEMQPENCVGGDFRNYLITERTLRQMCNVAVSAASMDAEDVTP